MAITITQAGNKDRERLQEFYKTGDRDFEKSRVEAYTSFGTTLIALDEENIVGTLRWLPQRELDSGVAEIGGVNVLVNYQKLGVGSELLKEGIKNVKNYYKNRGKKARKVFVIVENSNKAARVFYSKFGFNNIAKLNNLFSNNEETSFYCLDL
ncbi:MAG: GNAT family N-acetyltransferase [Patescibacteria group bacterium]|jgi:ribosomal protein S18 acetylase RimI-like enzyme